ncbi:anaerobic ribonucleoside-triphosphate reductase activating protein [Paramicrobacterium humi]|uniref:Anaerobic ribonucleoside-triphosphate reductase activating protein n=1 Tax=Paramicrobacterium humi TaxID=640635 RepID=A0A1H4KLV6_9MICO|nr:4Fe-4S single cluster domain-containing protein [Microbacterium humi]SEB59549.1 anaerobic ribonucleoside-triphosphate reductase activating protein [Microbacterium humi]
MRVFAESAPDAAALASARASGLGAREPAVSSEQLRWSRFLPATEAEGPGVRAALWVQGCAVRCPGCFNPQMWAARGGQATGAAAAAAAWVAAAQAGGAEGVTLLGGEPFDQAAALAVVAETFRAAGLTVMSFSGYPLDALERWARRRPDIARLLAATDLLCDGPYLREHPDARRPWIGSTNQGIRALSERYADRVRAIDADGERDRLEVRIHRDGRIAVNGWADDAALDALLHDLGVRGDAPSRSAPPRSVQPGRAPHREELVS